MTAWGRRAAGTGALTFVALLLAGCVPAGTEPDDAPSVEVTDPSTAPAGNPLVGQAFGGDFDPLAVPEGFPLGAETIPDEWLASSDGPEYQPGDTVIARLWQRDGDGGEPVVAISLDSVSAPLPREDWAHLSDLIENRLPATLDAENVQLVTYRIRHVGGILNEQEWQPGPSLAAAADLNPAMDLFDHQLCPEGSMSAYWSVFDGHDVSTGDTVQICSVAVTDTDPTWGHLQSFQIMHSIGYDFHPIYVNSPWQPPLDGGDD